MVAEFGTVPGMFSLNEAMDALTIRVTLAWRISILRTRYSTSGKVEKRRSWNKLFRQIVQRTQYSVLIVQGQFLTKVDRSTFGRKFSWKRFNSSDTSLKEKAAVW